MSNTITLAHGSGGYETEQLIRTLFGKLKSDPRIIGIDAMDDAALVIDPKQGIVMAMDASTVKPIIFPGGDIGKLAATGAINDVAVVGAKPLYALDSLIIEEGFEMELLGKIVGSMIKTLEENNVLLVGGDLKVMPRGELDGIIINMAVVGKLRTNPILDNGAKPGDKIIVSGSVGDHGAVITAFSMGINPEEEGLVSDVASVLPVMDTAISIGGIHAAKDPTRGGLATALNEIAKKSGVSIWIDEESIPITKGVRALMDLLGIDPLYLASEGKVVMVVDEAKSEAIVDALHARGYKDARIIGEVKKERPGFVILRTEVGGLRILEPLRGELTPRIC